MQTSNSSAPSPRSSSSRALAAGLLIAGLVAISSPGSALRAQQPTFRAGVDLLTIDVTAVNRDGRAVRDLKPEDFTVTVGGQPRKVAAARFYGTSETPDFVAGAAGDAAPAAPADVHRPTDAPARTVVFVVDRDSLKPGNEMAMLRATSLVFDGLSPADAVGMVGIPVGGIDLTREHDRVKKALPMMTGTQPKPLTGPRDRTITWDEAVAFERLDRRVMAEVIERECYNIPGGDLANQCPNDMKVQAQQFLHDGRSHAQTTLARLGALVDQLATIRGPKHIILLSGGLGFDNELLIHYNTFQRRAAAAQVVIYAIHLDQPFADASDRMRATSAFGGNTMTAGLGNLTAMTGGTMFLGVGTAAGVFERIRDQVGNFYQLAVESHPDDSPNNPRELKVTVNRPDITARARREIPAPAPATIARPTTDALAALLQQPTDFAQLPMAVATYTTRGTDETRLRVLISGEVGARPATPAADFGFVVLREGNVVAQGRQHVDASDAPPQIMTMATLLLPGTYRLRYASSSADGRSSASDVPLTVGLRAAGDFQVSDLLLGVADAGRLQPRSRVARNAPLIAMLELMSADTAKLAQARVTLELIPAGTAEPVMRLLMAASGDPGAPLLLNQASIDTSRLAPGRYTATAIPVLDNQPLGRVSRVFDVE